MAFPAAVAARRLAGNVAPGPAARRRGRVDPSRSPAMANANEAGTAQLLERHGAALLDAWLQAQLSAASLRPDLMSEAELRRESEQLLRELTRALRSGSADTRSDDWSDVRRLLGEISVARAERGFSPSETATFIFSLKQPLFELLQAQLGEDASRLVDELWRVSVLLDDLGLLTTEAYQNTRESVIQRQQQELLELSTPVVKLWQGILAVPLIGTLDSSRTQIVMESLLSEIVATGSGIAILDITGVPTVDTLVAQHLLKTIAAARLMGAEVIISGIRPQIAQTMVHLGIDLQDVTTKASLADAIAVALRNSGFVVSRASGA
jgi:rsbT co-antagonist protein RsbR